MNHFVARGRHGAPLYRRLVVGVLLCGLVLSGHTASAMPLRAPATGTPVQPLLRIQERAARAVEAFFAAYDRRDVPAISALLTARFTYADCDYARHHLGFIDSRPAVRRWLRAQFREHDRFVVWGRSPPMVGPERSR